jgi:uncharacterized membrane protein YeaQ/YmgE (transglycosylase-associated protein family)
MWILQALGFGHVPNDLALAMLIVAVVTATLMGWISDAVMRETGFGVIGNSILTFIGGGATIALWNLHVQKLTASQPVYVVGAAATAAITLLMACAFLRRFL